MSKVPDRRQRADRGWSALGAEALAAAVAVLLMVASGVAEGRGDAEADEPVSGEAVEARFGALPLEETVHGVVRAENEVAVRPEISAPVADLAIDGQRLLLKRRCLWQIAQLAREEHGHECGQRGIIHAHQERIQRDE